MFLHENICCGYSVRHFLWEPATMFSLGNKKNIGNFQLKTRNVSLWHRCPRPEAILTRTQAFCKKWSWKRAITLIIIGRFTLNQTWPTCIFCDYIPMYKIWIQYTNLFKKYWKEIIFQRWKRAITPMIMGGFYPKLNLTSILWLYTCVLNMNPIHLCFQKLSSACTNYQNQEIPGLILQYL